MPSRRRLPTAAVLVAAIALHACAPRPSADQPRRDGDTPAGETDIEPIAGDTAPVMYAGTASTLRVGERVGQFRTTLTSCFPMDGHVVWGSSNLNGVRKEMTMRARKVLDRAGVTLTRDPDSVFGGPDLGARYKLAGKLQRLRLRLCAESDFLAGEPTGMVSGAGSVTVTWELRSEIEKEVVAEITTDGSGTVDSPRMRGTALVATRAFADALRKLTRNQRFRALVQRRIGQDDEPDAGDGEPAPLRLGSPPRYETPFTDKGQAIRSATVTVINQTHGSGVFITPRLILTNQHVVKQNDRVVIDPANGERRPARVLRRDARRDVALLSTEARGQAPLPIRETPVAVGETVYAIGTPLDRGLEATVTKGTVSRRDTDKGLPVIQADVDVQGGNSGGPLTDRHGNIAGLSVTGLGGTRRDSSSIGINFFIPIQSALDRLNIELTRDSGARRAGGGDG